MGNWDIADSTDTCGVDIDKTRKGYCTCYGYDEDGRKGGDLITRNVGYSNCEENQPFKNCNELCNLHFTAMWRATDNCDANGERNRMYDLQGRRRSTATSRATASATTFGRVFRRTS